MEVDDVPGYSWEMESEGTTKDEWEASLLKHNRRKQLKPIRVYSNGLPDPDDQQQTTELSIETASPKGDQENSMESKKPVAETEINGEATGCGFCGQRFTSQVGLQNHVEKMHLSPDSGFAMDTDSTEPNNNTEQLTPSGDGKPARTEKPLQRPSSASKKKEGKIFHQDAYCEVCDREFCNKYFLKTHKANKHGIYDSNDLSFGATASMVPPQYAADSTKPPALHEKNPDHATTTAGEFCHVCGMLTPTKEHLEKHILETHPFTTSFNPSSLSIPTPSTPSTLPNPLGSYNPLAMPALQNMMLMGAAVNPLFPFGFLGSPNMPLPPFGRMPPLNVTPTAQNSSTPKQPTVKSSKSSGGLNADAYCTFCQKEFCNRYFLRTHMANKHNITMGTSPTGSMTPDESKNESAPLNLSARESPMPVKKEPQQHQTAALNLCIKEEPKPTTPIAPRCSTCMQQFDSEEALQAHAMMGGCDKLKPLKSANQNQADDNKVAMAMFESMMAAKMADRVECDICHKDYCNKYFLKTHKKKFHGVDTDAPSKSPTLPTLMPRIISPLESTAGVNATNATSIPLQIKTASPVASIHSTPPSSILHNALSTPSSRVSTTLAIPPIMPSMSDSFNWAAKNALLNSISMMKPIELKKEPTEKPICNFCGLEQGNAEKLLEHKLLAHPDKLDRDDEEVRKWRWKQPSSMARVVCDICNKELCNKYFLRIHKLNKHGFNDTTLPQRNSKPSPDDQQRLLPTSTSSKDNDTTSQIPPSSESLLREIKNMCQTQQKQQQQASSELSPSSAPVAAVAKETEAATNRYFSHFTEVCKICSRRFKSAKWLQTHMMNDHAQESRAVRQTETSQVCAICGMILGDMDAFLKHVSEVHKTAPKKPAVDDTKPGETEAQIERPHETREIPVAPQMLKRHWGQTPRFHRPAKRRFLKLHSRSGPVVIPLVKANKSRFTAQPRIYSCSICNFKTNGFQNLKLHKLSHNDANGSSDPSDQNQETQKFILRCDDANFCETIVELSVKCRVVSPQLVSFTLVPTE